MSGSAKGSCAALGAQPRVSLASTIPPASRQRGVVRNEPIGALKKRAVAVVTRIDRRTKTITMSALLKDAPSLKGFVEDAWTRRWRGASK